MDYHGTEVIINRVSETIFGDGSHESTQMALEALYQFDPKGKKVLDIGTGTGIQAIFAKKWGADEVMAVDIDASCIFTARKNFLKNEVEVKSRLNIYNELIEDKYDITVANLPAGGVVELMPIAKDTMAKDGVLIFSWNKKFRVAETKLEENGFEIVCHLEGVEWDSYVVRRKK